MPRRTTRDERRLVIRRLTVGLMALALLVLGACGQVRTQPTEPRPEEDVTVVMEAQAFSPEEITMPPGTTVVWTNKDTTQHTVTSGTRDEPTNTFDETVPPGSTYRYTFEEPGTYPYFCSIHTGMNGAFIVEEE